MQLGSDEIPFTVKVDQTDETVFAIMNGDEVIPVQSFKESNDTICIALPIYNSQLRLFIESSVFMSGTWTDLNKDNHHIPVVAEHNKPFRFSPAKSSTELPRRYRVHITPHSAAPYDGVLTLQNDEGTLKGTLMTERGDLGYLGGNIMNGRVNLSTFNGAHALLIDAIINEDSLIEGRMISGFYHYANWYAYADDVFQLNDPWTLSKLEADHTTFDFNLFDDRGQPVSPKYISTGFKIVIYEIMGSWCPNCKDASLALSEIQKTFGKNKVNVVPIAFEKTADLEEAKKRIYKMQDHLGISRGFVFGGSIPQPGDQPAIPVLPIIHSYPTIIFTDGNSKVLGIYSGFYGPATGDRYTDFMNQSEALIRKSMK